MKKGGKARARQAVDATALAKRAHVTRGGFEFLRRLTLGGHDLLPAAPNCAEHSTLRAPAKNPGNSV